MTRLSALFPLVALAGGCTTTVLVTAEPQPGPPLRQAASLSKRLKPVAEALTAPLTDSVVLVELIPTRSLHERGRMRLQRLLRARMEQLSPRSMIVVQGDPLPEASVQETDMLSGQQVVRVVEAPTHQLTSRAQRVGDRFELSWELNDIAEGETVAHAALWVSIADLRGPVPTRPLAISKAILRAIDERDGDAIAVHLHPRLARYWSTRAAARGQTLGQYSLGYCRGLLEFGPLTHWESDVGTVRAEVEAHFVNKFRDVDFRYQWADGHWGLTKIHDYR